MSENSAMTCEESCLPDLLRALALAGVGLVKADDGQSVIVTYAAADWRTIRAAVEDHVGDVNEWLAEHEVEAGDAEDREWLAGWRR